jgi:hypothetical protein
MVVENTTAYNWDWYCHLVGDRASLKQRVFREVIKTPSWKAWLERPSGIIKSGKKHKRFYESISRFK